ncbi:MAG: hypothetical protein ACI4X9_04810, partial [Kiritimatiellia bacterium]
TICPLLSTLELLRNGCRIHGRLRLGIAIGLCAITQETLRQACRACLTTNPGGCRGLRQDANSGKQGEKEWE